MLDQPAPNLLEEARRIAEKIRRYADQPSRAQILTLADACEFLLSEREAREEVIRAAFIAKHEGRFEPLHDALRALPATESAQPTSEAGS